MTSQVCPTRFVAQLDLGVPFSGVWRSSLSFSLSTSAGTSCSSVHRKQSLLEGQIIRKEDLSQRTSYHVRTGLHPPVTEQRGDLPSPGLIDLGEMKVLLL